MRKEVIITGFIFIFAVALLFFARAAHPDYPAFANPEFSVNGNSLSISDDIIYNTGYYSVNGGTWTSFTLQGTPYGDGQPWVLDSGAANLPNSLSGEGIHYLIVYSCSLANGAWECHGDLENGQMVHKWQLHVIDNNVPSTEPPSNSVAAFAQCVTNAGAVMYGTHTCGSCQTQKSYFGDDFQYINFIDCATRGSECDAADISGWPTWIINGQKYGLSSLERLSSLTGCSAP